MKAVLVTSLLFSSSLIAAPPTQMPVPTMLGPKAFRDGDVIEITDVRATSPKLEQGDSLTVYGRVRLASQDKAQLALYLTQTEGDGREETDPSQTIHVKRGRSDFELKVTIKHRGVLHLTLYDRSGQPFGGVYFGTTPQMKQIENWSLDYYLSGKSRPTAKAAESFSLAGRWLLTMPRGFEYDATLEPAGEVGLYRLRCGALNLQGLYEVRGRRLTLVKPDNQHLAGVAWEIRNNNALQLNEQPNQAHVGSDYRGATLGRQTQASRNHRSIK